MKKKLIILLFVSLPLTPLTASSLTLNDLKAQHIKLLTIWQQQQPVISQILLNLKRHEIYSAPPLTSKNLTLFIHHRLVSSNLFYLLKKQQQQILKLCKDINQICEDIKTLSSTPH